MQTIGIVGYGSFGVFLEVLIRRFAPKVQIKIHSSRFEPDGKKFFSFGDVAQCNAVILSVPIHAFEVTLIKLIPLLAPQTILVDVATVKVYTVEILKRLALKQPYIATHPMFGPESYAKTNGSVAGYRVVITDSTLSAERREEFVTFLKQCGFTVVEMTAEQHDKHLAETLFLAHFIGQIVTRGTFNRTEIDTVSFGSIMDAAESVKHDTELFKDVYRFNRYCEEVLKRFEIAETEVHALLQKTAA